MGLIMVVGGQLGSESKGKVTQYMYDKYDAVATVRVGGPNSGHTAYTPEGNKVVTRCLPVTCWNSEAISVLAAGTYIDLDLLYREVNWYGVKHHNLFIDENALILDKWAPDIEKYKGLRDNIGSTCTGTGEGVVNRVQRSKAVRLAKNVPELEKYVCDTKELMRQLMKNDRRIIVEGTQGYGLSLLHTKCFPYCTSRDTTAAGFLSEIGLSPFDVERIAMVLRTFPIRVGGNSGPMYNEITWKDVTEISGSPQQIKEYTTVTQRLRRVGVFDPAMVRDAIQANRPTDIILNFCDYLDYECFGKHNLTAKAEEKVKEIEGSINAKIDYVGTAPQILFER